MSEKKVLIVTYYWPPSGGSGVQRWLKFVKYLPQFGWKPFVFTPENPSFAIRDESLLKDIPDEAEVIHFPIWEPYDLFFKTSRLFGKKLSAKPTDLVSAKSESVFQKISTWIRGNFFIPDPRVFWVRPSVQFLRDFLIQNNIKVIITTGPPHSVHLIGLKLRKMNPSLKWLADFRDPWSEWGFLDSLKVGGLARKFHRRLERNVLTTADEVITITPFYVRKFEKLAGRPVRLLTNGFDEDDFRGFEIKKTDKFIIRHVGIVNEKCDPRPFMRAVKQLLKENEIFKSSVKIDFVGEVHPQFKSFVAGDEELNGVTTFSPSVPHSQLISLYRGSSVLLLILTGYKDAEGYMPGKLFEYLAAGLPVLAVGPVESDAAEVLERTHAGEILDGSDITGIASLLMKYHNQWSTDWVINRTDASSYSRKTVARKLTDTLDSLQS